MAKNIHVIKDETLGGVKREYVEVDRKAEVGDLIVITKLNEYLDGKYYDEGHFGRVIAATSEDICADFNGFGNSFVDDDGKWFAGEGHEGKFAVLEPTDIVHIKSDDGKSSRFRLVDRKAEVGERVIVKMGADADEHNLGKVYEVMGICELVNTSGFYVDDSTLNLLLEDYHVLVPIESEQPTKNYDDIIARLVRKVAQLESELTGAKRDIETWAQEVEGLRNDLAGYRSAVEDVDAKVEMCIDDIVTLDERSREAQTITLDVETFTKIIGGDRR